MCTGSNMSWSPTHPPLQVKTHWWQTVWMKTKKIYIQYRHTNAISGPILHIHKKSTAALLSYRDNTAAITMKSTHLGEQVPQSCFSPHFANISFHTLTSLSTALSTQNYCILLCISHESLPDWTLQGSLKKRPTLMARPSCDIRILSPLLSPCFSAQCTVPVALHPLPPCTDRHKGKQLFASLCWHEPVGGASVEQQCTEWNRPQTHRGLTMVTGLRRTKVNMLNDVF